MRVRYFSDIHLEFQNEVVEDYFDVGNDVDAVVIAGDISVSYLNAAKLKKLAIAIDPVPLIYVTGNHDFYHGNKQTVSESLSELSMSQKNFHFLNNSYVVIDDVVFIGTTGWQDDPSYNFRSYYMMNDFRLIDNHENDVNDFGKIGKQFICDALEKWSKIKKTVVVTHVIPCVDAIRFGTYEVDHKREYIKAYYNSWNDIIDKYSPDFWICGHCHDSIDVTVGKTRILRNALGYKYTDRENVDFDKTKSFFV